MKNVLCHCSNCNEQFSDGVIIEENGEDIVLCERCFKEKNAKDKNDSESGLFWDLLEALQDGVLREIRQYLEAFNPCEREKQSLSKIQNIVSEIYDEYTEKARDK